MVHPAHVSIEAVKNSGYIASPNLTPEQVGTVRAYLLALDNTDEGKKKLEPTQYTGLAAYDTAAMLAIGTRLGL